jgi:hypothetical protein
MLFVLTAAVPAVHPLVTLQRLLLLVWLLRLVQVACAAALARAAGAVAVRRGPAVTVAVGERRQQQLVS